MSAAIANMVVEAIDEALHDLPTSKVIDRFVMNDILLDLKSRVLSFEEPADVPVEISTEDFYHKDMEGLI